MRKLFIRRENKQIFYRALFVLVIVIGALVFLTLKKKDPVAGVNSASYAYFKENVAPILASSCSKKDEKGVYVCHGTSDLKTEASKNGSIAYQHLAPNLLANSCETACHRMTGKNAFSFGLDENGKISSEKQMVYAYIQAKKLATYSNSSYAKILRYPMAALAGGIGLLHPGGEIFDSENESQYQTLANWAKLENIGNPKIKVTKAEEFFGKEVLPIFARRGCLSPNCHAFNHSTFIPDPGIPTLNASKDLAARFTPEQVSYNRLTTKGLIQDAVHLSGDAGLSRILRKIIPLGQGGILHRGGNDQFLSGPEDPDFQKIKEWIVLEKDEAAAKLQVDGKPLPKERLGRLEGIVFVRTQTGNSRKYLDVGKYLPGGDLFLVNLGAGESLENTKNKPVNLTARFHKGKLADIRKPSVRFDGRAILFSMRVGEPDNLNIYEIRLDDHLQYVENSFRRLTFGPKLVNGNKVHYTDPLYVPNPDDTNAKLGGYNLDKADIVFVSNLSGNVANSMDRGIVGEADGGSTTQIVDFDRPEVSGSFVGRHVFIVDGVNKGEWRKITKFENRLFTSEGRSYLTVDRPFPKPIDNSSIYVIEKGAGPEFLPSYSVYGMKTPTPEKEEENYQATLSRITLGVGQEMDLSLRSTGEIFYSSLRSSLDKYDRPIFNMGSTRRHLDTRFSFPTHQGNRSEVLIYASNHEMPTGIDIHAGLDPNNLWEGGNLSVSDHQLGPGIEARNPNDYATGFFDEKGFLVDEKKGKPKYKFSDIKRPSHTRFLFTHSPLFPLRGPDAVTRTGYSPGGIYRDPIPLPNGDILVSHSPKPINHFDPKANPDFDLYVLKPAKGFQNEGGRGVPEIKRTRLAAISETGVSEIEAYPIYARLKSKMNAAGRPNQEHLIRHQGMADDYRPAFYLERNYLMIDAVMKDPSPVGKQVAFKLDPMSGKPIDPIDEIKYVRMVEVLPTAPDSGRKLDTSLIANKDPLSTPMSNGISSKKRIVAEAPVEEDGSIFIKIPSKIPLIIQSLNGDKMALRQEARHYFFAPNERFTISPSPSETFQTCGACMGSVTGKADRLFGPVNSYSGARKVVAIAKAGGNPIGYGLEVEDRMTIDFQRDIQPILDRRCVSCHSGDSAPKGLSLTGGKTPYYNVAYESLQQLKEPNSRWFSKKKYVSERNALAIESYLIAKIYGKQLKVERTLDGDLPHPSERLLQKSSLDSGPLTPDEKLTFVRWIDMGAAFLAPGKEEGVQKPHLQKKDATNDWRDKVRMD